LLKNPFFFGRRLIFAYGLLFSGLKHSLFSKKTDVFEGRNFQFDSVKDFLFSLVGNRWRRGQKKLGTFRQFLEIFRQTLIFSVKSRGFLLPLQGKAVHSWHYI
jgi:hypothetical protein